MLTNARNDTIIAPLAALTRRIGTAMSKMENMTPSNARRNALFFGWGFVIGIAILALPSRFATLYL